ncbi:MAG: hypothetical protein EZS26_002772, partial [Candidatus Ordinivivax streblomastigis]
MKKTLCVLLLSLFSITFIYAYNAALKNSDGVMIYYDINSAKVTATVTYASLTTAAFFYKGNVTIPREVSTGGKVHSVTSIGDQAFYNCPGLTSITIPNSITSIGNYAFSGCSGLTGILAIPNSVTSIGSSAFSGCGLTNVILEDGTTTLSFGTSYSSSANAFYNCPITSLYLGRNISYYDYYSPFKDKTTLTSLTISNSVTSIGNSVFEGCSGLTRTLTIPNSVTSIGNFAFSGCSGLTGTLTIPNSVTSIGSSAFSGCSGLTNLILEDGTTTLSFGTSSYAVETFSNCPITTLYLGRNISYDYSYSPFKDKTTLTSLTIPNLVTSIGSSAFRNCSGLTELIIPNSVTSIEDYAFYGCSGLTELIIGNSVTSIEDYAFYGCSGLTELIIGNSVTAIEDYAFSGCSGLTALTIPNSITSIKSGTFRNCSGLIEITIPNSVTTIESYAFLGCSGVKKINSKNPIPPQGDKTVFTNVYKKSCIVYVPIGSLNTYKVHFVWEDGTTTLSFGTSSYAVDTFSNCPITTLYLGRNISYDYSYSPFKDKTTLTSLTIPNLVTS